MAGTTTREWKQLYFVELKGDCGVLWNSKEQAPFQSIKVLRKRLLAASKNSEACYGNVALFCVLISCCNQVVS